MRAYGGAPASFRLWERGAWRTLRWDGRAGEPGPGLRWQPV